MPPDEFDQTDRSDMACLRQFVREGSQRAFAVLVRQRIDLVYSSALRQVNHRELAEDVTQMVFVALAKKATGIVDRDIELSAWLLRATRLSALDTLRRERRRRTHEQRAAVMNTDKNNAPPDERTWAEIRPLLDEALESLGKTDRRAITLRYFETRSLSEVGQLLGVSEVAARQRIWRALERLRTRLKARSASVATAELSTLLTMHAVHAAPATLADAATHAAMAAIAAKTAIPLGLKGSLQLMALTKAQIVGASALAALLFAGTAATIVHLNRPPAEQRVMLSSVPDRTTYDLALESKKPTPMPADARARFNLAYALAPGQTLKRMRAPFIPERAAYFQSRNDFFGTDVKNRDLLAFTWDGQQADFRRWNASPATIGLVIQDLFDLPSFKLDMLPADRNIPVPGDWVMRHGSSLEQQFADLAKLLEQELQLQIHFETREALRPVIVATGSYAFTPLPMLKSQSLASIVHLYLGTPPRGADNTAIGDRRRLLRAIGEALGREVIDETSKFTSTTGEAESSMIWSNQHLPATLTEEQIAEVTQNLTAQTHLTFTFEKRIVPYWAAIKNESAKKQID